MSVSRVLAAALFAGLLGAGPAAHAETTVPGTAAHTGTVPSTAASVATVPGTAASRAAARSRAMTVPSASASASASAGAGAGAGAGANAGAGAAGAGAPAVSAAAAAVTVRGRAWNDRNRDGIRQDGEPGIAGLPVAVFAVGELAGMAKPDLVRDLVGRLQSRDTGDGDIRQAVTGRDGTYTVSGLPAGTVVVLIGAGPVDRAGKIRSVEWAFSRAGAGSDRGRDSDFVPYTDAGGPAVFGVSDVITISGGGSVALDAGLYRRPALAVTGVNAVAIGGTGFALVGVGFVLVRAARRRA